MIIYSINHDILDRLVNLRLHYKVSIYIYIYYHYYIIINVIRNHTTIVYTIR